MDYFNRRDGSCLGFFEFSRKVGSKKIKQLAKNTNEFINSDLHIKKEGIYFDREVKKDVTSRVYSGNFFASGDIKLNSESGPDFKILLNCVPYVSDVSNTSLLQGLDESDYNMLLSTYNRGVGKSSKSGEKKEKKKISALTSEALYDLFVDERYEHQNQNGAFTRPLGKAFELVCEKILDSCIPKNSSVQIRYQCEAVPDGDKLDAIVLAESKYDLSQFFFKLSKAECISLEEFN